MDNEEIKIQASDPMAGDGEAISRLLGGLERVDAPADFDFRVRARIADGKPSESGGSRLPLAVRYAAGLCSVLLLAGLFGFIWLYSGNNTGVPAVAVVDPQPKLADRGSPSDRAAATSDVPAADERAVVNVPTADSSTRPLVKGLEREAGNTRTELNPSGDSIESSTREAKRILPKGISTNPASAPKPKDFDRGVHIQAADVLILLGINATYSGSGWLVNSLTPNGAAERVGLKAGDVVEAINEQSIAETTSFSGTFSGKSLRVRRGGQVLRIDLAKK
jgi:membrane-associated protease RseP (regulator of RpoE activity)